MDTCPNCNHKLLSHTSAKCNWCGAEIADATYRINAEIKRNVASDASLASLYYDTRSHVLGSSSATRNKSIERRLDAQIEAKLRGVRNSLKTEKKPDVSETDKQQETNSNAPSRFDNLEL